LSLLKTSAFVGCFKVKLGAYTESGAPKGAPRWVGLSPTHKYLTKTEVF